MKDPGFLRRSFCSVRFAVALGCCACVLTRALFTPAAHAQDTAYPAVDAQIHGPATASDRSAWLADLRHWRTERLGRIGYDGSNYSRPEFRWTQRNFICVQMMIEERTFFDSENSRYTVDHYLDALEKEFGGVDSVLIWNTYPNLGVDQRNQFDRLRDMPGGVPAVKQMVADFHRRGVKVLFPETPWDLGTRDEAVPDWIVLTKLLKEVGADGILGDTMDGVPHVYLSASERVGNPLALLPEGLPPDETLAWNEMTWGYWTYPFVPMVSRYKWLEPRHMPILTSGGRHHIDQIQAAFFNGVGFSDQEDVIGLHNGFTPRDAEVLRRVMKIERSFAALLVSPDWEPHTQTLQDGIFASKFSTPDQTLWTLINRNDYEVRGKQIEVPATSTLRYFDLWHGVELLPEPHDRVTLSFDMEGRGFGAILAISPTALTPEVEKLLGQMRVLSAKPLADFSDAWTVLPQRMSAIPPAFATPQMKSAMVLIPGDEFEFSVRGVEIAGGNQEGVDVQYPWEDSPRRIHNHTVTIKPFYIDRYPVTNSEFKRFLDASHYRPRDEHNFLRDWRNGTYPQGWDNKPVTWVSLEDARAFAQWAGKRLPFEWEWQYAAQGRDGRKYPWGSQWNPSTVPTPDKSRQSGRPDDVDAHPEGSSPFGVMDMVGNIWQWTNEFEDDHTRSAILRGGSYFQPQGSMWYFPQAYRLDQHGKYLLTAPSIDRSGAIGFRCAADAN